MAKELYILCEGERDDVFYETLAERVTSQTFSRTDDHFRVRHGANWKTAMAAARLLMSRIKHWHGRQEIAVIVAVDNDRSPGHPGGTPPARTLPSFDQKKQPRYPELKRIIEDALGPNRNQWPVDVAIAMPVEMVESWVLTLLNPERGELPIYAEAAQGLARQYYGSTPPPQLKDLRDQEAAVLSMNQDELFFHAASCDHAAAEAVSPSLKMFTDELRQWRS